MGGATGTAHPRRGADVRSTKHTVQLQQKESQRSAHLHPNVQLGHPAGVCLKNHYTYTTPTCILVQQAAGTRCTGLPRRLLAFT